MNRYSYGISGSVDPCRRFLRGSPQSLQSTGHFGSAANSIQSNPSGGSRDEVLSTRRRMKSLPGIMLNLRSGVTLLVTNYSRMDTDIHFLHLPVTGKGI